jgi:hypothetical protein
LLLGSPGLNDAALQVLQACAPDRRIWLAGCESVWASGRQASGAVEIRAVATVRPRPARPARPAPVVPAPARSLEAPAAPAGPAPPRDGLVTPWDGLVTAPGEQPGQPEPGQPDLIWDITAVDAAGQVLITWQSVRLREAGLLARTTPWPPSLLPVYLEHGAIGLGLDPDLRVSVCYDDGPPEPAIPQPWPASAAPSPLARIPRQAPSTDGADDPGTRDIGAGHPGTAGTAAQAGATQPGATQAGASQAGASQAGVATANGPAGWSLTASGARFAACGWAVADPQQPAWPTRSDALDAFSRLCSQLAEPPAASAARLHAVAACLARAHAPADAAIQFTRASANGWALLEAAGCRVACTVVTVSGVADPVAIALLTDPPRRPVPPRLRNSRERAARARKRG